MNRRRLNRPGQHVVIGQELKLCLELLALGDVPGDRRDAVDPAVGPDHRRHRERHVDPVAVSVPMDGLQALDPLPAPDPPRDPVELVGAILAHQQGDGLPDHLGGRVSVEALGAPVPADDRSVEVLADDCVPRGLDDRGQVRPRLLCLLALREVDHLGEEVERVAALVPDQRHAELDPDDRAIRARIPSLDRVDRLVAGEQPPDPGSGTGDVLVARDRRDVQPQQPLLRQAGDLAQRPVDPHELPQALGFDADQGHPHGGILERGPKALLALGQGGRAGAERRATNLGAGVDEDAGKPMQRDNSRLPYRLGADAT